MPSKTNEMTSIELSIEELRLSARSARTIASIAFLLSLASAALAGSVLISGLPEGVAERSLSIVDADGNERIRLAIDAEGNPLLEMLGRTGDAGLTLSTNKFLGGRVQLSAKHFEQHVEIGGGYIVMSERERKTFSVESDSGTSEMVLRGGDAHSVWFKVNNTLGATQWLIGGRGEAIQMSAHPDGGSSIAAWYGNRELPVASLSAGEDGANLSVRTNDGDAEVLADGVGARIRVLDRTFHGQQP